MTRDNINWRMGKAPRRPGWMDRDLPCHGSRDHTAPVMWDETRQARDERVARAKKVCVECDVRNECLEWALDNRERGVWGATDDRERARRRK